MVLSLVAVVQVVYAASSTWGQCSCLAGNPKKARYSIVKNASLCVNVEKSKDRHPICDITIHCLDDNTGPNCKAHSRKTGSFVKSVQDLTKVSFSNDSKLSGSLMGIFKKNSEGLKNDCWKIYSSAPSQSSVSWKSRDEKVRCVVTLSGWLHVIISSGETRKPLARNIQRVSYQFSPLK